MTPLTTPTAAIGATSTSSTSTSAILPLLALLLLASGLLRPAAADTCPRRHWYSSALDACVPCTQCQAPAAAIVLRPCQLHQDTVCGTLNDLEFEWNLLQRQQHQQQQQQQMRHDDGLVAAGAEGAAAASAGAQSQGVWDWQPSSMAFAAVACVLFVVALIYILYQHAKQWRHMENMERRFDRDVEQLSAQLMHNIVDLRTIDTSSSKSGQFAGSGGSNCGSNSTGASTTLHRMHDPAGLSRADTMRSSTKHAKRKPQVMAMNKATLGRVAGGVPTAALIVPASAAGSMGADMLPGEMRCVYLEQLLVGPAPIRGNVYTEDTAQKKPPACRPPNPATNLAAGNGISAKGLQRMQSAFGKK